MSAWVRILEVSSVSIVRVLNQNRRKRGRRRRRRKKLGIIAPSRSSLWGIQKGKEIPEKMKTGTRHQKQKKTKKTEKEKEKEKSSKYKRNQRGKIKCQREIALIDSCQPNRTQYYAKIKTLTQIMLA